MEWINAQWNAPLSIKALTTTRQGGCSKEKFKSNNLASHVKDDSAAVEYNRRQIQRKLELPSSPYWLEQTHSSTVVNIPETDLRKADASIAHQSQHVLAVLTADCLPILICNKKGSEIAAIHAGWRGLLNGIVESTLGAMHTEPSELMAWIGPGICGNCFEIGADVLSIFTHHSSFEPPMLTQKSSNKWRFDLSALAVKILQNKGLNLITNSKYCTFECSDLFYSYRRDNETGRMASLIWIENT